MQHLLTEEEYKNLVPQEWYVSTLSQFYKYYALLLALGEAVDNHPDHKLIRARAAKNLEGNSYMEMSKRMEEKSCK